MLRAGKLYVPVHVIPFLLFRARAQLRAAPAAALGALAAAVLRSTLFLSVYVTILRVGTCGLRHARGRDAWWHPVMCGLGTYL
jgi:hypothetical protein